MHFSSPSLERTPKAGLLWEALGELRGRAWENMWEIKPAKRNEKHISWCEGKRMQSPDLIHSLKYFRHLLQKGESTFGRTNSIPNLILLQEDPSGIFAQNFTQRITAIPSLRMQPCRVLTAWPPGSSSERTNFSCIVSFLPASCLWFVEHGY